MLNVDRRWFGLLEGVVACVVQSIDCLAIHVDREASHGKRLNEGFNAWGKTGGGGRARS